MENFNGLDIFKMAEQIASSIPDKDKKGMQGMNLEELVSTVSGSVFKHMKNSDTSDLFGMGSGTEPEMGSSKKKKKKKKKKPKKIPDILEEVSVSLEELYLGCEKVVVIKRPKEDGTEKAKFTITIEPGMEHGKVFTFEDESGTVEGYRSGNVYITLVEEDHEDFERDDEDIWYDKNFNLSELFGLNFNITTLGGRVLNLKTTDGEILQPNCVYRVEGEGMPRIRDIDLEDDTETDIDAEYGDMYIRCTLKIENHMLGDEDLDTLKRIFPNNQEEPDTADETLTMEMVPDDDDDDDDDDDECDECDTTISGDETDE